ncbi:pyocin knob domain-containing protein, partial [Companilactobacillus bobalius]|uniref:pyocin knob domain-containing protein n=1 Tax=Companilactobacillus bobalius TaxID=2801451 RepID=UPI00138F0CAF
ESAVSKASPLSSVDKPQLTKDANWDDYANSGVYLVQGASGGNNIPIGAGTTWGYLMVLNGSPSGGAVQIYYDCVDTPVALYMRGTRGDPLAWSSWIKLTTLDSLNGKTITGKDSAGKDISIKITGIS